MDFRTFLRDRIVVSDGAFGTLLQQRTHGAGTLPERLNTEDPQAVASIHRAYLAAGADMILIPEMPFSLDAVCDFVTARVNAGERCTMIAVAEGAQLDYEAKFKKEDRAFVRTELGETTVTRHLSEVITERTGAEARYSVLGYLQRGGTPCAFDRLLCSRLGGYAARLAAAGRFGVTVAFAGNKVTFNALADIAGKYKFVSPESDIVRFAKDIGISFGVNA